MYYRSKLKRSRRQFDVIEIADKTTFKTYILLPKVMGNDDK